MERDIYSGIIAYSILYFNSHAHVERDKNQKAKPFTWHISTHTLTWSVTQKPKSKTLYLTHFNSHAHVERDVQRSEFNQPYFNFNSHAHVERDDNENRA